MSSIIEMPINHPDRPAKQIKEGPVGISLTRRELQVLGLIADGKSTKQVAAILGITFKTASSHRSRLLAKFSVHESVSLVRRAIRAGIIQP
jgi:DNA-binding CsgD family transcriptional regulator